MLGPCPECMKNGFKSMGHVGGAPHRIDGRPYADFIVQKKEGSTPALPSKHPYGFIRGKPHIRGVTRTDVKPIAVRQAEFEEMVSSPEAQLQELFELDFEFWECPDNYTFVNEQ